MPLATASNDLVKHCAKILGHLPACVAGAEGEHISEQGGEGTQAVIGCCKVQTLMAILHQDTFEQPDLGLHKERMHGLDVRGRGGLHWPIFATSGHSPWPGTWQEVENQRSKVLDRLEEFICVERDEKGQSEGPYAPVSLSNHPGPLMHFAPFLSSLGHGGLYLQRPLSCFPRGLLGADP